MPSNNDLIGFQQRAAARFLQIATPPDARAAMGLEAAFRAVFPIENPARTATLQYLSYQLERPKYDPDACLRRGYTWAAPIKVLVRLVCFAPTASDGSRQITDIKEQEVYFGEIPLLTGAGTCIIDGEEKVLIARIERASGPAMDDRTIRITDAHHNTLRLSLIDGGLLQVDLDLDPDTPPSAVIRFTGASRTLHLTPDGPVLGLAELLDGPPRARRDILAPDGTLLARKGRPLGERLLQRLRAAGCLGVPLSDRDVTALRAAADIVSPTGALVLKQHTPLSKADLRSVSAHGIHAIPVASLYDAPAPLPRATFESPEAAARWFDQHIDCFELTAAARASMTRLLGAPLDEGPGPLSSIEVEALARRLLTAPLPAEAPPPAARLLAAGDLLARRAWIAMHAQAADLRGRMAKAREIDCVMPHDLINARPFMSALSRFLRTECHARPLHRRNLLTSVEHARRALVVDPEALAALGALAGPQDPPEIDLPLEASISDDGTLTLEGAAATPLAAALVPPGAGPGAVAMRRALPPIEAEAPAQLAGLEADVVRAAAAAIHSPCDGEVVLASERAIVIRPDTSIAPVILRLHDHLIDWSSSVAHERPVVACGVHVRAGDVVAEPDGSAGGLLALGRNVIVVLAGDLAEDAVVVSARTVRAGYFTTHDRIVLEIAARDTRAGCQEIARAAAPPGEDAELDESGIVREGAPVSPGDVLVAMRAPLPQSGTYEATWLRVPPGVTGVVRRVDLLSRSYGQELPRRAAWLAAELATLEAEKGAALQALADACRRQSAGDEAEEHRLAIEERYDEASWFLRRGEQMPPGEIHRVRILIERERPLEVGAELRDRHGRGGRVVEIRPDDRMPRTPDGTPADVLLPALPDGPAGLIFMMRCA